MILGYIIMLVLGRLIIWAVQTSGLTRWVWKLHPILTELGECDFCLGFWVYLVLAIVMGQDVLEPFGVPILSEIATAIVSSFIVHLVRLGWQMKFSIIDMSGD